MGVQSPSRFTRQTGKYVNEGLALGLKESTPALLNVVASICKNIIQKFSTELSKDKFVSIGSGIGKGLAEGLSAAAEGAKAKATEVAQAIALALKTTLTDLMKKEEYYAIGKGVGDAVAEGLLASVPAVKSAAQKVAEAAKVSTGKSTGGGSTKSLQNSVERISSSMGSIGALVSRGNIGNNGSVTTNTNETVNNYNFVQNNTSPKALSRLDIYRDTRNLLRGI